jgi:hypothetical protein
MFDRLGELVIAPRSALLASPLVTPVDVGPRTGCGAA